MFNGASAVVFVCIITELSGEDAYFYDVLCFLAWLALGATNNQLCDYRCNSENGGGGLKLPSRDGSL